MDYRCVPVLLSARATRLFYDGCSNRALRSLCHFFQAQAMYNDEEWEAYVQANRIFCEVIAQEVRGERKEMQTAFWRRPRRSTPQPPLLAACSPVARSARLLASAVTPSGPRLAPAGSRCTST